MVQGVFRNITRATITGHIRPKTLSRRQLSPGLAAGIAVMAWIILAPATLAAGTISVLYAGSLVNLMEHGIGPAFDKASGDQFQGYPRGSQLLANQIKGKLRQGDVFISANPAVNKSLMGGG